MTPMLGPNGAGKSTTVGMLTTTIAPTSGRAHVAGFDVSTHPIAARQASAVVFQEPVVDLSLTVRRNLPGPRPANVGSVPMLAATWRRSSMRPPSPVAARGRFRIITKEI